MAYNGLLTFCNATSPSITPKILRVRYVLPGDNSNLLLCTDSPSVEQYSSYSVNSQKNCNRNHKRYYQWIFTVVSAVCLLVGMHHMRWQRYHSIPHDVPIMVTWVHTVFLKCSHIVLSTLHKNCPLHVYWKLYQSLEISNCYSGWIPLPVYLILCMQIW